MVNDSVARPSYIRTRRLSCSTRVQYFENFGATTTLIRVVYSARLNTRRPERYLDLKTLHVEIHECTYSGAGKLVSYFGEKFRISLTS